jgi:histidinol-phosphate aminotransferase
MRLLRAAFHAQGELGARTGAVLRPPSSEVVDLAGRVAVVTGSSRGIGRALAEALLARGARVVLNGRDAAALEQARVDLGAAGGVVTAIRCDVSTDAGAAALIDGAIAAFGRVDLLFNNAGITGPDEQRAWEAGSAAWRQTLAANLEGPILCSRHAVAWMAEHGVPGRIVNVSSGITARPAPGHAAYLTSKAALEAFTHALALDLEGTGVCAVGVQLGATRTDMHRARMPWDEHQLLPPAALWIPALLHAATGEAAALNGRVIAAWRFNQSPEAEVALAAPLSTAGPVFPKPPRDIPEHVAPETAAFLELGENQLGMPPAVQRLLAGDAAALELSRYPDLALGALRKALARRHDLPEECFSFGNGSTEIIERLLRVFARPGEGILATQPTWFVFERLANLMGARLDKVALRVDRDAGFVFDLERLAAALRADTRLVYLIHPSNPTGAALHHEPFAAFLERVPPHVPIVIDEAYVEFADRDRPDLLHTETLVRGSERPILGLRTFSKIFGLAGLRCGYAYGSPRTIAWLDTLDIPFRVSSLTALAAEAALADDRHVERAWSNNQAEKARIAALLLERGCHAMPTQANMLLFEAPFPVEIFAGRLRERGVLVPPLAILDRWMLWPIALPAQNDTIMAVVRELT